MDYTKEYDRWCTCAVGDKDVADELRTMTEADIEDAFYRNLSFGTGGLRGVLGAGTNRMNIYTVAKATQGLADYINNHYENGSVAVSYDSRIKSDLFAKVAAGVLNANGIKVFIYPELMPTPCLSFAVRRYGCSAGIMITASHNPAKYNGYKVYNADGCQITTDAANEIFDEIEKLDVFEGIKSAEFSVGLQNGMIEYISDDCYTAFIEQVKQQSVLFGDAADKNVSIVYSPLNGTGLKPVTRALRESGFANIVVVKEQEQPDGHFPTCPFPNPEIAETLALGLEYAEKHHADLMLATDPDCDRVGIAVKDGNGYKLLTGNEVGILLLDYICSQRKKHAKMPPCPMLCKTIVTTDMADRIAAYYGVETVNVLTGFKFIGEQIGFLEERQEENRYIFGFEESYGYLSGSYVRDKDGVDGAFLICEMFAFYKAQGKTFLEKLDELYKAFGYQLSTLHSFTFEGVAGMKKMAEIMQSFRDGFAAFGGKKVLETVDYLAGVDGVPKADVLKLILADNCSLVIRPSGTEPKIKVYISVAAETEAQAKSIEAEIAKELHEQIR